MRKITLSIVALLVAASTVMASIPVDKTKKTKKAKQTTCADKGKCTKECAKKDKK